MKVICAMNQKGGAGKTTVLLNLMITARAKGRKTTLIDLDPQRSAEKWADLREIRAKKDEPVIVHAVSYTHLTLPTIYSVYILVVAVTLKKKKK